MRVFPVLLLLPALLMAQTPPPKPAAAAKPAATPGAKPPAAAKPAAAKPAPAKPVAPPPLTTDDQKTVYAVGLSMYRQLSQLDLSPAELEIVKRALSDAVANKPAVELTEWGPKIQPFAVARGARVAEREKAVSATYLAKAAAEPGAAKMESGLIYRELQPGTGDSPKATDTVKVNYRGTLVNGTEFDSSYKRNQPAEFQLNGVIKCWTEGVQKMKSGGKSVLICPSDLAYGDQGRPSIPGGSTLIFEIELLEIKGAGK
ncbi:MAG TPA: FKBP-type peptidyl-prolyl cis-trans isomerase [Candidatus Acidoferrales bacterium]|nr:FKBP-type peptidyl-prolyl cis-trans isomerase [Candidatus Acidoferrales bacterium]